MITKNKQSPTTLYLLNSKYPLKPEQEKKSARLSFNKKKSARSISQYQKQYQKWNPIKQSAVLFQPADKNYSDMKKILLNKNQFGLESLPIQKKLHQIIQIFSGQKFLRTHQKYQQSQKNKAVSTKNTEHSLLNLNLTKIDAKRVSKPKQSHKRASSLISGVISPPQTLQNLLCEIKAKFTEYQKRSDAWKFEYLSSQNDQLLDRMVKAFKELFWDVLAQWRQFFLDNVEYFQNTIIGIVKDYETETAKLKQQIQKQEGIKQIVGGLFTDVIEKHQKNVFCSILWENLQKQGKNLEEIIQKEFENSQLQTLLKKYSKSSTKIPQIMSNYFQKVQNKVIQQQKSFQNSQNQNCVSAQKWQNQFQNRQSIKGVLKYIHNNTNNQKLNNKNMNSTVLIKQNKDQMKIDSWKNFEKNEKSIGYLKKILSQR